MRHPMLVGLVLSLSACDMPHWWPEALGGPEPPDKLVGGPLRRPLIEHPERYGLLPLRSVGRNGLRATIAPSFGTYSFVVDLVPQPLNCYLIVSDDFDEARAEQEGCHSIEARYTLIGGTVQAPSVRHYRFVVPGVDYARAVEEFNRLARRWRGSSAGWLDGTTIGVEQFSEGELRSIASNSPPERAPGDPAAIFSRQLHRLLLAYAPAGTVPLSGDFTVADRIDAPCMGNTLNVPDPDGFGTGDDACARHIEMQRASPR
jgi:hypothetical protein